MPARQAAVPPCCISRGMQHDPVCVASSAGDMHHQLACLASQPLVHSTTSTNTIAVPGPPTCAAWSSPHLAMNLAISSAGMKSFMWCPRLPSSLYTATTRRRSKAVSFSRGWACGVDVSTTGSHQGVVVVVVVAAAVVAAAAAAPAAGVPSEAALGAFTHSCTCNRISSTLHLHLHAAINSQPAAS